VKFFIHSILLSCLAISSFAAPWGGGTIRYNPLTGGGFLTGRGPSAPPFYNPGPGGLSPIFSYTQSPYGPNQLNVRSNLSTEAKKVIGKWTLRADELRENPEKITDTNEVINNDRNTLENALKAPNLTQDERNSIGQILTLLKLAEVRMLTSQVAKAKEYFPDSYRTITGDQKASSSRRERDKKPKKKDWYTVKRDRLDTLLISLKKFLNSNPQFKKTPPDLLIGILTAIEEGDNALNIYSQLCSCLDSPNLPYCKTLVRTSAQKETNRRSSRLDPYNRDEDEDEDED
jgi:hypothetical protein